MSAGEKPPLCSSLLPPAWRKQGHLCQLPRHQQPEEHAHTFVSYPAPSGLMLDTNEWVDICVHPRCMLVRTPQERPS